MGESADEEEDPVVGSTEFKRWKAVAKANAVVLEVLAAVVSGDDEEEFEDIGEDEEVEEEKS